MSTETESDGLTPPAPRPREFVGPGALVGLGAWVVGYLLTLGLTLGLSALTVPDLGSGAPLWQVGAWLFYAAHLVVLAVAGVGVTGNVIVAVGGGWYLLAGVPPVALALAGGFAVGRVGVPDPVEGAKAGAAVALGYVGPSVVAAVLLDGTVVVEGTTYALVPGAAAVVAVGVVYPVVVGALGGAVSAL